MASRLFGHDLVSTRDLCSEDIISILDTAATMEAMVKSKGITQELSDKLIACLFLEPSTRTRLSFEAAALRLGAKTISVAEASGSSVAKGETLSDTIRVMQGYADCIVMRQPQKGGAAEAAATADIPVINAGDGAGEHPTQALLDLYTIRNEKESLVNLTIAMTGDLKNGRTVHSLTWALAPFAPSFIFCAPAALQMPDEICTALDHAKIMYKKTASLEEAVKADVIYMTRIQRERFLNPEEYDALKGCFVLTRSVIEAHNPGVLVMHPLPRIDEIAPDVDTLPGAAYFRQAHNGMYVRMAILSLLLKK
ncbi:MAG: aspartate carbamoyltransferase [Spirochaetales bacterium]|nr:aspartate carbamoyltransferase [Spirochaetales bacterium]